MQEDEIIYDRVSLRCACLYCAVFHLKVSLVEKVPNMQHEYTLSMNAAALALVETECTSTSCGIIGSVAELHVQNAHPLNGPNLKWQCQEGKACNDRQHHKVAMMRYAPAKGQSAKQLCHLIHSPQGSVCLCQGSLIASACKYVTLADWKANGNRVQNLCAAALTWSDIKQISLVPLHKLSVSTLMRPSGALASLGGLSTLPVPSQRYRLWHIYAVIDAVMLQADAWQMSIGLHTVDLGLTNKLCEPVPLYGHIRGK